MDFLTRDQLETATLVLVTMLLVLTLLLLWTFSKLAKYGEFDNLFDTFRPSRLPIVEESFTENKADYEEEILTEQIGPCSKILAEGKGGRLYWQFSKEYLERLNNAWDERHEKDTSKKPCVITMNENCHEESPRDPSSGNRQKHGVKWNEFNSIFWYEESDSSDDGTPTKSGLHCGPTKVPKPILKKTHREIVIDPRTKEFTQGEECQKPKSNLGFKYVTKTLLSFLDDATSEPDGLNEVEQGIEPSISKPRQFQYISKSLLSFLEETPEESV